LIALPACGGSSGPLDPGEQREISRARTRWESRHPAEYTYESRFICFCDPATAVWTEVHVRGDSVIAVRAVDSLPSGASATFPYQWLTVARLFSYIESAARDDVTRDVVATFDGELGYPRSIEVRCVPEVLDCGITILARNLRVIR
jgi:hypothetical protein